MQSMAGPFPTSCSCKLQMDICSYLQLDYFPSTPSQVLPCCVILFHFPTTAMLRVEALHLSWLSKTSSDYFLFEAIVKVGIESKAAAHGQTSS